MHRTSPASYLSRARVPLSLALLAALVMSPGDLHGQQLPLPGAGGRDARLAIPELPPLRPDSPRDSLLFADRVEVRPAPSTYPATVTVSPTTSYTWIDSDETGTGYSEKVQIMVPSGYDPASPAPLVVAYHGFGMSAGSVAKQSTIDEECEARGWLYLSVTGLDDKLFGSALSQRNVEAAIRWMLATYSVDADRIYMVGFSMGAGVSLNFAARHRDPDGIVIAAVGAVSGASDWTLTWTLEPSLRPWLEHGANFGGPPATSSFNYRRSSGLFADPLTYPPLPGTPLDLWSMATNLEHTPVFLTWDVDDSLGFGTDQQLPLSALLNTAGSTVVTAPVSGTTDGIFGLPAPHSWAVLDEAALFAFLEQHSAVRRPAEFSAQVDRATAVSWTSVVPRNADGFVWLQGEADPVGAHISVTDVQGAAAVTVAVHEALGSGVWPARISASSDDAEGFTLTVVGDGRAPSYFLHTATGQLVEGTESDPNRDALSLTVPAGGAVDVIAVSVPWTVRLWMEPDPAAPGSDVDLFIDAPSGPTGAWLIVSLAEALTPLSQNVTLVAYPLPPAIILPLGLGPSGDVVVEATLPANPGLSGVRMVLQAVTRGPGGLLGEVSNAFGLDIE